MHGLHVGGCGWVFFFCVLRFAFCPLLPRSDDDDENFPDPPRPPIDVVGGSRVVALGELVTDDREACLAHWADGAARWVHPYPVGYRATRSQWGHDFDMTIERGPVFAVLIDGTKRLTHVTPSGVWEAVLKHLKGQNTKHRVSGPLYFGFSDSVIIRKIKAMDGCQQCIRTYGEAQQ